MTIEQTELRFPYLKDVKDVTASFTAYTNVPARLQVWMHDLDDPGKVTAVDVRMFLRELNIRRDAIPVHADYGLATYLPGSREIDAHLHDGGGWGWKFQTINGHRVAVPVKPKR